MDCMCWDFHGMAPVKLGLRATLRQCWLSLDSIHVQIGPHGSFAYGCCMIGYLSDVFVP